MAKKAVFLSDIVIVLLTIYATYIMFTRAGDGTGLMSAGFNNLKYFTVLSNEFCGVVAAMSLIRGIITTDELNFTTLKFIAATMTGVTFAVVAGFLQPVYPEMNMYKNANLYFHLIIPVIAMAQFLFIYAGRGVLSFKRTFFAMMPPAIYGLGYILNILINGFGEWPHSNDWYGFLNWGWGVGAGIFGGIILFSWILGCALWGLGRAVTGLKKRAIKK